LTAHSARSVLRVLLICYHVGQDLWRSREVQGYIQVKAETERE